MKTNYLKGFTMILLFATSSVFAQHIVFTGTPVGTNGTARVAANVQEAMQKAFTYYELYSLNGSSIEAYLKGKEYSSFTLVLGTAHTMNIDLQLNDLRSDDFQMVVLTDKGEVVMPRTPAVTYKGWANNDADQYLRVSIYDGAMKGYIMQNGEELFIEPVSHYIKGAAQDLYMVYKISDVVHDSGIMCGVTEMEHAALKIPELPSTQSVPCMEADIALACDKSYTTLYGSSTAAGTGMQNTLNLMDGKYRETAIGIGYKMTKQYIVDLTGTDPWSTSTDAQTLLQSFTDWGKAGNFGSVTYDMANLWTKRNIAASGNNGVIGLAWVGVVCGSNKYGIMEHYGSIGAAINYVDETHECGHMWNASHTATSSTYILSPSIGNGNTVWDATTTNTIVTFKNGRSCLVACSATGVQENSVNTNAVSVFPNPSSGRVSVNFNWAENEIVTIEVFNALGERVYTESMPVSKGNSTKTFDLSSCSQGVYFLHVKGASADAYQKLILQ